MSQKIFLSACLIVRDSEEDLAWCLAGLAGEGEIGSAHSAEALQYRSIDDKYGK